MDEYIFRLTPKLSGRFLARPFSLIKYEEFIDACENADFRDYYYPFAEFDNVEEVFLYIVEYGSNDLYKYVVSTLKSVFNVTYYPYKQIIEIDSNYGDMLINDVESGEKIWEKMDIIIPDVNIVIDES